MSLSTNSVKLFQSNLRKDKIQNYTTYILEYMLILGCYITLENRSKKNNLQLCPLIYFFPFLLLSLSVYNLNGIS